MFVAFVYIHLRTFQKSKMVNQKLYNAMTYLFTSHNNQQTSMFFFNENNSV